MKLYQKSTPSQGILAKIALRILARKPWPDLMWAIFALVPAMFALIIFGAPSG